MSKAHPPSDPTPHATPNPPGTGGTGCDPTRQPDDSDMIEQECPDAGYDPRQPTEPDGTPSPEAEKGSVEQQLPT